MSSPAELTEVCDTVRRMAFRKRNQERQKMMCDLMEDMIEELENEQSAN